MAMGQPHLVLDTPPALTASRDGLGKSAGAGTLWAGHHALPDQVLDRRFVHAQLGQDGPRVLA